MNNCSCDVAFRVPGRRENSNSLRSHFWLRIKVSSQQCLTTGNMQGAVCFAERLGVPDVSEQPPSAAAASSLDSSAPDRPSLLFHNENVKSFVKTAPLRILGVDRIGRATLWNQKTFDLARYSV
jgi:hypothetical protein